MSWTVSVEHVGFNPSGFFCVQKYISTSCKAYVSWGRYWRTDPSQRVWLLFIWQLSILTVSGVFTDQCFSVIQSILTIPYASPYKHRNHRTAISHLSLLLQMQTLACPDSTLIYVFECILPHTNQCWLCKGIARYGLTISWNVDYILPPFFCRYFRNGRC